MIPPKTNTAIMHIPSKQDVKNHLKFLRDGLQLPKRTDSVNPASPSEVGPFGPSLRTQYQCSRSKRSFSHAMHERGHTIGCLMFREQTTSSKLESMRGYTYKDSSNIPDDWSIAHTVRKCCQAQFVPCRKRGWSWVVE